MPTCPRLLHSVEVTAGDMCRYGKGFNQLVKLHYAVTFQMLHGVITFENVTFENVI